MPISHQHRCIFVHIPKCAGTSIESALSMHVDKKDVGIVPDRDRYFDAEHLWGNRAQHFTIHQIREHMEPEAFEAYFKFTFVRNPWDRFVSFVAWKQNRKGEKKWIEGKYPEKSEFYVALGRLLLSRLTGKKVHLHLKEQWRYVCDADGRLMMDFVGKFENLEDDWARVCEQLGINRPLEKRMRSKHHEYPAYYNFLTRRLVGWLYRRDVRLFGYTFDNSDGG